MRLADNKKIHIGGEDCWQPLTDTLLGDLDGLDLRADFLGRFDRDKAQGKQSEKN